MPHTSYSESRSHIGHRFHIRKIITCARRDKRGEVDRYRGMLADFSDREFSYARICLSPTYVSSFFRDMHTVDTGLPVKVALPRPIED